MVCYSLPQEIVRHSIANVFIRIGDLFSSEIEHPETNAFAHERAENN